MMVSATFYVQIYLTQHDLLSTFSQEDGNIHKMLAPLGGWFLVNFSRVCPAAFKLRLSIWLI